MILCQVKKPTAMKEDQTHIENNKKTWLSLLNEQPEQGLRQLYKAYRIDFVKWITQTIGCTEKEGTTIFQKTISTFYERVIKDKSIDFKYPIKNYLIAIGREIRSTYLGDTNFLGTPNHYEDSMQEWERNFKEKSAFVQGEKAPRDMPFHKVFSPYDRSTLRKLFAQNPAYKALLQENPNISDLLRSPTEAFEWKTSHHRFNLNQKLTKPLPYTIENNQGKLIAKGRIFSVVNFITLSLPIKELKAGRYYIKLQGEDVVYLQDFFIRMDLKPSR